MKLRIARKIADACGRSEQGRYTPQQITRAGVRLRKWGRSARLHAVVMWSQQIRMEEGTPR